jgi:hypothetical protein
MTWQGKIAAEEKRARKVGKPIIQRRTGEICHVVRHGLFTFDAGLKNGSMAEAVGVTFVGQARHFISGIVLGLVAAQAASFCCGRGISFRLFAHT